MNFNLISPDNKASEFRVNFKDPIKIKQNSKIELNWAEFKRKGEIILNEDQEITIFATQNLPTKIPSSPNTQNDITFALKSIPAGSYTFSELQKAFEDVLNGYINTDNLPDNAGEKLRHTYISARPQSNITVATQGEGEFGFIRADAEIEQADFSTVTNKHDAQNQTTGGQNVIYTTHNNTSTYDNYANFEYHFDTFRGDCNGVPESIEGDVNNNGLAFIESINIIDNQTGKIGFGITGLEYSDGIGNAPPARTTGDNPPVLKSGVPANFIWIEFDEQGGNMTIYMAVNAAGEEIRDWKDQNQEIADMKVIDRMPMDVAFDTTERVKVIFEMGMNKTQDVTPEFRWRLYNNQNSVSGTPVLLYDSHNDRRNLPFKLCVGETTTYDNATALNSQIPFGFQASVTDQNQGWRVFDYAALNKTQAPNANDKPLTIMRIYNMTVGDELAAILGSDTGVWRDLYPNGCQSEAGLVRAPLDFNWRGQNYSIFINLPANNYKNVEDATDGGFKKSILANIPSPFTTGSVIAQEGSDSGQVVSIYQPYQPIISSLENNEISTNVMEIKIVDMKNEVLASELTSSIVNFTIRDN